MGQLTDEQLITDLRATFPGIWAKPAAEYGLPQYQRGVWIAGEVTLGELPIFSTLACNDPDEYNGTVLHAFEAWLAPRGYELDTWDAGVYFAVAMQPALEEAQAS